MKRLLLLLAACREAPQDPCDPRFDLDRDGHDACADCDDDDPSVHPGADERCNGVDDDCDGAVDDTPVDATPEVCNGVDDDCDGTADEAASDATWLHDADGDGFGTSDVPATCEPATGRSEVGGDCDDGLAEVRPGATERWNARDDDCDGTVDRMKIADVRVGLLHGDLGRRVGDHGTFAWGGDVLADGRDALVVTSSPGTAGSDAWVLSGAALLLDRLPLSTRAAASVHTTACEVPWPLSDCELYERDLRFPVPFAEDLTGDGVPDLTLAKGRFNEIGPRWIGDGLLFRGGEDLRGPRAETTRTTSVLPYGSSESLRTHGVTRLVAADLDGDGHADLVVARSEEDDLDRFPVTEQHGTVRIFPGPLCPDDVCPGALTPGLASAAIWGPPGTRLGAALATGDVDGDGLVDLVLGHPGFEGTGALRVLRGGADLLDLSVPPPAGLTGLAESLRGPVQGDRLGDAGRALAVGPLSDDAPEDLAAGLLTRPEVLVWRRTPGPADVLTTLTTLRSAVPTDTPGVALCMLPGWLLVGDPAANAGAGAVYALREATLAAATLLALPEDADAVLRGSEPGERLGAGLACGPDLDGDGHGDALAGATGWHPNVPAGDHGALIAFLVPPP